MTSNPSEGEIHIPHVLGPRAWPDFPSSLVSHGVSHLHTLLLSPVSVANRELYFVIVLAVSVDSVALSVVS